MVNEITFILNSGQGTVIRQNGCENGDDAEEEEERKGGIQKGDEAGIFRSSGPEDEIPACGYYHQNIEGIFAFESHFLAICIFGSLLFFISH